MEDIYKSFIISKISQKSGIVIAPVHSIGIISYVEKFLKRYNISVEKYCALLDDNKSVLNDLINHATTNETYFFREEKQFDYLSKVLFPAYRYKKLVIWSAACSSGEEPLSLLALALSFNINVEIYASDIDDNVLNFFKKGCYSKYSFRKDGEKYLHLLKYLGSFDENMTHFQFRQDVLQRIKIFKYNLTDFNNFPIHNKIDIIFMRNVFIYFDTDTRKKITANVTNKLSENGHLFYSINEIGNINSNIVPNYMKKENYDQIYFYVKKSLINSNADSVISRTACVKPCDVFNNMNSAIREKHYDEAFKIATEYKPEFSDSYYSSFFKGYALMNKEDYNNAEKYFITSEFMKKSFWPVYYFHGILLEKIASKEKAVCCYKTCLEQMKYYFENPTGEYNFLLKDVSPSFIYSYCFKNIKE